MCAKKKKEISLRIQESIRFIYSFYILVLGHVHLNVMSHFNRVLCPAASAVLYEAKHDPVFTHPSSQ